MEDDKHSWLDHAARDANEMFLRLTGRPATHIRMTRDAARCHGVEHLAVTESDLP